MSIHSGLTKKMVEIIQQIQDAENDEMDFMSWDGFLKACVSLSEETDTNKQLDMLVGLLVQNRAPAYRYLTRALLKLFDLDWDAEVVFKEASRVLHEHTTEKYEQPHLRKLADLVFETMVSHGFTAERTVDGKPKSIHISLWKPKSTNTKKALCGVLFSDTIDKEAFFTLSLGLLFHIDFVQDYIQRVLLSSELNMWDYKEALLYALLSTEQKPDNLYQAYRSLLQMYETGSAKAPASSEEQQQTAEIKCTVQKLIDLMSEAVNSNMTGAQDILAQYKYLVEQQQQNVAADHAVEKSRRGKADRNVAEEKAAARKHLHTATRKFFELKESVEAKLKEFDYSDNYLDDDSNTFHYFSDNTIQTSALGKYIYGFPYKEFMGDDNPYPKFAALLDHILDGKWITPARMTQLSNGEDEVRRDELMTMAFLDRALDSESPNIQSAESYGVSILKKLLLPNDTDEITDFLSEFEFYMDDILSESGFDTIYLMNPYDSLLLFLSSLYTPFSAYRYIWSIYMSYKYPRS